MKVYMIPYKARIVFCPTPFIKEERGHLIKYQWPDTSEKTSGGFGITSIGERTEIYKYLISKYSKEEPVELDL